MEKQTLKAYVTKVNDDFTIEAAIASTEAEDRQGEIIPHTAWRLDNFKRNPVLQWAHNYSLPPIGKVEDIRIEGNKLTFKPRFAAHIDPFAEKIWRMFKDGYLNAFSVGFQPLAPKEGNKFTDVELLEISAVPVPANPEALVLARSLGLDEYFAKAADDIVGAELPTEVSDEFITVTMRDVKLFLQDSFNDVELVPAEGISGVLGTLEAAPDSEQVIYKLMFNTDKWTIEDAEQWAKEHRAKALGSNIKGVVRFEATSKEAEDNAWSGRLAERRIRAWAKNSDGDVDFTKYKRGFAWFDDEAAKTLAAYKLPHHDIVDGKIVVNLRGVRAAMGALLGARGGVKIPTESRLGVYNHLARHYVQFDIEPPELREYAAAELKDMADEAGMPEVTPVSEVIDFLHRHADTDSQSEALTAAEFKLEAEFEQRAAIISTDQKAQIETTLEATKLAADTLTAVLKGAHVKATDGKQEKPKVGGAETGRAIKVTRQALKRATAAIEEGNRAIKIILK